MRRVIEPLLSGASVDESSTRDLEYVRDLGLVAREAPPRMANPIYAEVVPRELTYAVQEKLLQDPVWYVDADGGLDLDKLLADFQGFFREHSEHWVARFDYAEAGPQLLLQAFLQRIVNSGGRIEREYGLGRGTHRSADHLAATRWRGTARRGQIRDRVQGAAREPGAHGTRGVAADRRIHGPVRGAGGPPGHLRPRRRQAVGGQDLPSRRTHR